MASISGSVTIAGDPDDWIATAFDADTHAFAGVAAVSGGVYEITGLTAGQAYMVACRPKSGPVWTASRETYVDDYVVAVDPVTTPHVFKATTAPSGDPYFSNVSLLLHCDGANGSNTFTDSSSDAITVNVTGNTIISTSASKFGGASAYFDGFGDYLTATIDAPGTGDFTMEYWLNHSTQTGQRNHISLGGHLLYCPQSSAIRLYGDSADRITGTTVPANGNWYHIALARSSGLTKLFVNGTQEGASWSDSTNLTGDFQASSTTGGTMNGYMDEIRVTVGHARYTDAFTAPYAAFPDTAGALTGLSEPDWDISVGNTTSDGSVIWTAMGRLVQPLMQGPLIAA